MYANCVTSYWTTFHAVDVHPGLAMSLLLRRLIHCTCEDFLKRASLDVARYADALNQNSTQLQRLSP